MATQKHTHKFKRLKYKTGSVIFFCALPDCSIKMNPALLLGKRTICWLCGNEFILDEYALRLAKPHCVACHKPKDGRTMIVTEVNVNKASITLSPELSLEDKLKQTIKAVKTMRESQPEGLEDEI